MLDVAHITDDGNEARFSCPYPAHGFGDKNPSAYMNLHTTAFICFSCGASGNAITFLSDVKQVPRLTAKNWIAQKWAPHYAKIDDLQAYVKNMLERQDAPQEEVHQAFLYESEYEKRIVDWEGLQALHERHGEYPQSEPAPGWASYMFDRGFDATILNIFDFCYDEIADRPCLTVRERDGRLVGFKGRAWREDQWPKYMVIGDTDRAIAQFGERYGFAPYDASKHVFAAHIAEPINGQLIVCEGELNVVSMYQKGFTNVVGPSGSTLSDTQIEKIVSMCEEVVILFDTDASNEQSYATAQIKILKAIKSFEPYVAVRVCEDHEGDPAEMDRETLKSLVDNSVSSTMHQVLARCLP